MKVSKDTLKDDLTTFLAEGLTHREIGERLGVAPTTVTHWCRMYHLPKARKYERNLERKYGSGALHFLRTCYAQGVSDAEIAAAFGVSRERVRQWRKTLG
jgi:transcriptional regulator with XRE-family HTH domain